MNTESVYLVAGSRPWSRKAFDELICRYPGSWNFVGRKDQLTGSFVRRLDPRYLFFLHWSWIVPDEIVGQHECVCFHMTDVPYGRGGSPLQNLIVRGHRGTKLTALRMTSELDAGPVYLKEDLSLDGSAEEIFQRAGRLAAHMIERIIREQPHPVPQTGSPVIFKRRKPRESRVPSTENLEHLYDFIRMLDAEGYPRAFLEHGGIRYEFGNAVLKNGELTSEVRMKLIKEEDL